MHKEVSLVHIRGMGELPYKRSHFIKEGFRKMFGNIRVTFGQNLENLRKTSESGCKSSENRKK